MPIARIREITAFWKNDRDNGIMMTMNFADDDQDMLDAMRVIYTDMVAYLRDHPVVGKIAFIKDIDEFGVRWNSEGRPSYSGKNAEKAMKAVEIMLKIAALEKHRMIVSDEYTGVLAGTYIENFVLQ